MPRMGELLFKLTRHSAAPLSEEGMVALSRSVCEPLSATDMTTKRPIIYVSS